ncbi:DNA-directed RNA polymerase subunit beta [Cerasibacillus sp. JNUCC 74]
MFLNQNLVKGKGSTKALEEDGSKLIYRSQQKTDSSTAKLRQRSEKHQRQQAGTTKKRPRLRIFPIWLRIIVVSLLCIIALVIGLMVGYGVIGDGTPIDALKKETWQHIIDIVTKTN